MRFTLCGRVLALAAGMALTAGATPVVAADLAGPGDDHPAGGRRRLKQPPRPD